MGRVRAPNFDVAELIAHNNLCFPTSWRHLPFRFCCQKCVYTCERFYTCIEQMSSNGV